MKEFYLESLDEPAFTVMKDVCGVKNGERVLIVTNPKKDVLSISMALYEASVKLEASGTIIIQEEKYWLLPCEWFNLDPNGLLSSMLAEDLKNAHRKEQRAGSSQSETSQIW